MNRRECLSLLGSAGLAAGAGCLASGSGTPPDDRSSSSPSETPTASPAALDVETPAPGACEAEPPPRPSTGDGVPDPEPYPERPATIEPGPVRTFLEAYETAYRHNRRLADVAAAGDCLKYLDMHATGSTVRSVANGVVGEVTTRGSFTGAVCPDVGGTETPTPLPHADLAPESARYLVTDRFLVRNGTVLECWG